MSSTIVKRTFKIIDIGANLTDPVFRGIYHGNKKHENDLVDVLTRSKAAGVEKIIVTGGSLEDSFDAITLSKTEDQLFATVGCHPTRCLEFESSGDPDKYLNDLSNLIDKNKSKVVAVGECGLDYDRLQFCPADIQKLYFSKQLKLASEHNLPLFLHSRNAHRDFVSILQENKHTFHSAVVHSFTGSKEEAAELIEMGLFIGINGCSLKTNENLEVVKSIPVDRIMIETDSPWCEVKATHASSKFSKTSFPSRKKEKWEKDFYVKGRNEPSCIVNVLEILAAIYQRDVEQLAEKIYKTTEHFFFNS